ncbi:MAG TPA: hypothetical protein VF549_06295 [Solirubrobacteraceae bacterium]
MGSSAIGLIVPGGPLAASALGVLVQKTMVRAGDEFEQRQLGPREKARAGAALAYALIDIDRRLDEGQAPRDDGFFDNSEQAGASRADELLEAVLARAQRDFEERKLRHLSYLYSAIVFREDVAPAHATWLLEVGSRLTYEQLVLIAVIHEHGWRRMPSWPAVHPFDARQHRVAGQLFDMVRQGLLGSIDGAPLNDYLGVDPHGLQVQTTGYMRFELMRLGEADAEAKERLLEEIYEIANELPPYDLLHRLAATVETQPLDELDLDLRRIRVAVAEGVEGVLPREGQEIAADVGGEPIRLTAEPSEFQGQVALVCHEDDRETFDAILHEGRVLRASAGEGGLWLL